MMRLSLIVPVYNVDKYLTKCLDSLLNQNIAKEEYEIIIINDGSTDDSLLISEHYKKKYSNIQVITQVNQGLGEARNTGINAAIGEYLFFVDSDDYIKSNSLQELLDLIESRELDVLRFNYEVVSENGEIIPKKKNSTFNTIYSDKVVDGEEFITDYLGWACYVWIYLFKTSFIKTNKLYFKENFYYEDVDWLIKVMMLTKSVSSIDINVYFYLQRLGSITQSIQIDKINKNLSDKLENILFLKSIILYTNNDKLKKWCYGFISITFMGIFSYIENRLPNRKNEVIKFIRNEKLFPFKSFSFTFKQKRDVFLMNLSPLLYCYLKKNR